MKGGNLHSRDEGLRSTNSSIVSVRRPNAFMVMSSVVGCLRATCLFFMASYLLITSLHKKEMRQRNLACMQRNALPTLAVMGVIASLVVVYLRVGALKNAPSVLFKVFPVACFVFLFSFHLVLNILGRSERGDDIDYAESFREVTSGKVNTDYFIGLIFRGPYGEKDKQGMISTGNKVEDCNTPMTFSKRILTFILLYPVLVLYATFQVIEGLIYCVYCLTLYVKCRFTGNYPGETLGGKSEASYLNDVAFDISTTPFFNSALALICPFYVSHHMSCGSSLYQEDLYDAYNYFLGESRAVVKGNSNNPGGSSTDPRPTETKKHSPLIVAADKADKAAKLATGLKKVGVDPSTRITEDEAPSVNLSGEVTVVPQLSNVSLSSSASSS